MPRFPFVGEDFAGYRITGQLGRGGMGVVFAAEQQRLGRTVALKVLSPELAEQPDYRERFSREAAVLASLDSPHIIAIFDHGEHDGCLYIATQYVTGGDLSEALKNHGPMPTALGVQLVGQVAWALDDAHTAGVVHRDIKPSNVLLRTTGSTMFAYLCDFGIAQNRSLGITTTGSVAGTFAYLSPERLNGEAATPAADIYALGCVLWTSLMGGSPYVGTDVQIAMSHLNAPVPQVASTSPVAKAVNRVLQLALAKSPADRYRSADAMRADLHALELLAQSSRHRPLTPVAGMGVPWGLAGTPASAPSGASAASVPSRPPAPSIPSAASPPWGPAPVGSSGGGGAPPSTPSYPPPPARPSNPGPPPSNRRRTRVIVAATVVAVLVIGGGIGAAVAIGGGADDEVAKDPPTSSPVDSPSTPIETPTDTPPETTPVPTQPTSDPPKPRKKPEPKPFYPKVPAASGPTIRLGAASLNAPAGWGTIDAYRFDDLTDGGVGARDYPGARPGVFQTSVYIYRSVPRLPLDSLDPATALSVLNSLALGYVQVAKGNTNLTLVGSTPLGAAWLDGVRAARIRATYHDAGGNRDFSQETWFVPRGKYIYRVVFEHDRSVSIDARRSTIDPSVVSFRFAG